MINYDIFSIITKYLVIYERPILSFINKEFNRLWKKYAVKYNYMVMYGHNVHLPYDEDEIICDTNNYLHALEVFNKKIEKEIDQPDHDYRAKKLECGHKFILGDYLTIFSTIRRFRIIYTGNVDIEEQYLFYIIVYDNN